jgi:hypothetical protein
LERLKLVYVFETVSNSVIKNWISSIFSRKSLKIWPPSTAIIIINSQSHLLLCWIAVERTSRQIKFINFLFFVDPERRETKNGCLDT